MARVLNTTDYAILGLLARRPWSAYEMARYMRTSNIRAVWPRAESRIYESPKKLAAMELATATPEQQGGRSRMVYTITEGGRAAHDEWLREEGKPFVMEYESLLKLALGDIADREHRQTQVKRLGRQAELDWEQMQDFVALFAEGETLEVSGDRAVQNLLINSFIRELLAARMRWRDIAADIEGRYAACTSETEKLELVTRCYRELLEN